MPDNGASAAAHGDRVSAPAEARALARSTTQRETHIMAARRPVGPMQSQGIAVVITGVRLAGHLIALGDPRSRNRRRRWLLIGALVPAGRVAPLAVLVADLYFDPVVLLPVPGLGRRPAAVVVRLPGASVDPVPARGHLRA